MPWTFKVRKWLGNLLPKRGNSFSKSSSNSNRSLLTGKRKSSTWGRRPGARDLPVEKDHLKELKRLDEWDSVVNYFANDLYTLQDAMVADLSEERMKFLAAKAQMASKYLEWALDRPTDEEG